MDAEHELDMALYRLDAGIEEKFIDARWWENVMLPVLGLNDENPHELPNELLHHAGGLRIWQYPNQFGPYIATIARMAHTLDTYIEIGCRHGGTFIVHCEVLRRLNPRFKLGVAVDVREPSPLLNAYMARYDDIDYWQVDTASPEFSKLAQSRTWDLAFIDGDHSYNGVRRDWETMQNHAVNVVFHDIASDACPGVAQLWAEVNDHSTEFTAQYDSVPGSYMGIGLMERESAWITMK